MASQSGIVPSQDTVDHRTMCKYGENCYQTNPMHLEKYRHPMSKKSSESPKKNDKDRKMTSESEPEAKKPKLAVVDDITDQKDKENEAPTKEVEETDEPKVDKDADEPEVDQEEVELIPDSPSDVKESIKQKFLVDMPKDFYHFWDFCKERNHEKPEDALWQICGLKMVGPFEVLSGQLKRSGNRKLDDYLCHWRYYYDTPEFQTVIVDPKTDFHIGYFRDDPNEDPVFVASNDNKTCHLKMMSDNLFGAVFNHIVTLIKDAEPSRQTALQKLKASLHVFATMKVQEYDISLDIKTQKMKARDRIKLASTFHGAGMVVPYNKDTEVGYREIPETTASLKKIFKNVNEAKTDEAKNTAMDVLQELITNVQFANDEGDPGMGLELGLDAFCFGGDRLHSSVGHLLGVAYELLKRDAFAKILKAHLKRRQTGSVFQIQ